MKKFIAILVAMTLLFSCIAIPASAAGVQDTPAISACAHCFQKIGEAIKTVVNAISNFFTSVTDFFFGPDEPEKPYLVHQDGMEDVITIDRENMVVYGFHERLRTEEISKFVKVNDETLGELEIVPRYIPFISGTGSTINVLDKATGEVVESYKIVIFGDVNGDADTDAIDSGALNNMLKGTSDWSGKIDKNSPDYSYYMVLACDLDKDGAVTEKDYDILSDITLFAAEIDAATGKVTYY